MGTFPRTRKPKITSRTSSPRTKSTAATLPHWLRSALVLASAALLCSAPLSARGADEAVPVTTILSAYERATHADDVKSLVAEGSLAGEGLAGTFHSWRAGNDERDDDTLGPREETTLRLGERIFVRNTNGNVRELRGYLHRRSLTDELIDSGDFVRHPELTSFAGWGVIDGRRLWRLTVDAKGGEPETLWIDPGSGLPVRTEYLDGDGQAYVDYSDWRDVDGRKIPFRSVQSDGDHAFDVVQTTTSVAIDTPVDPARFAPLVSRTIGTDRVHTVPLIERAGHVFATVRIAGRDWLFLLDTGAQSILVDRSVLAAAGVTGSGSMEVRGAARTGGMQAARLPSLTIDGAHLDDLVVSAIDIGKTIGGGLQFDGILGYPFFASALVQLDFSHKVMRFGPPGSFAPDGNKVDLDVDRELAEAQFTVNARVRAPFIVDTGNSSEMLIYRPFLDAHPGIVPFTAAAGWNYGIGGGNASYRSTLDALEMGGITLYHRAVEVVLAKNGAFADRVDAGNVGLGVLRNFDVTFDLGNAALYLAPGAAFDDGRSRVAHRPATSS